jgi:hypothetical protein
MNLFSLFAINMDYKRNYYSGIAAPFPGTRNNLPYFFRISFGITYWADLSFQDGYWKTFTNAINKEWVVSGLVKIFAIEHSLYQKRTFFIFYKFTSYCFSD